MKCSVSFMTIIAEHAEGYIRLFEAFVNKNFNKHPKMGYVSLGLTTRNVVFASFTHIQCCLMLSVSQGSIR